MLPAALYTGVTFSQAFSISRSWIQRFFWTRRRLSEVSLDAE